MKVPFPGAIDCDIHPAVPATSALVPYLDDYWRDQIVNRYIVRTPFSLMSYPWTSPLTARPDRRPEKGPPGSDFDMLKRQALDANHVRFAICNVLHGAAALFNEDMSAALCRAVNDWTAAELLDRDPRLRASILIAPQNPAHAVEEIERLAGDKRFVQVLMFAMGEMLHGRRINWPIYEAAERHGLAIGVHAGSLYRHAPTPSGYPSYQVEDYVVQGAAFEHQMLSFVLEGVFDRFPDLKVVLMESGITWLPTLLWRTNKVWRGARTEVPWVHKIPATIFRDHFRLTLQPLDLPNDPALLRQMLEHIGSDDMILFSSDYPHWQYDGDDVLPDGFTEKQLQKVLIDNALATYPRLRGDTVVPFARNWTEETVR